MVVKCWSAPGSEVRAILPISTCYLRIRVCWISEIYLHIPSIGRSKYRLGTGQWESWGHSVAVRPRSSESWMLRNIIRHDIWDDMVWGIRSNRRFQFSSICALGLPKYSGSPRRLGLYICALYSMTVLAGACSLLAVTSEMRWAGYRSYSRSMTVDDNFLCWGSM